MTVLGERVRVCPDAALSRCHVIGWKCIVLRTRGDTWDAGVSGGVSHDPGHGQRPGHHHREHHQHHDHHSYVSSGLGFLRPRAGRRFFLRFCDPCDGA